MPETKTGAEKPATAITEAAMPGSLPRSRAASTPSGRPSTTATRSPPPISSRLRGMRRSNSSSTGSPLRSERPRSPWNRPPAQVRNCEISGRSRPSSRVIRATASGSLPACSPSSITTGSPGRSWIEANTTMLARTSVRRAEASLLPMNFDIPSPDRGAAAGRRPRPLRLSCRHRGPDAGRRLQAEP